jgi:hypothetical protein
MRFGGMPFNPPPVANFPGSLSVNGGVTLGDAAGDSHLIRGSLSAPNATTTEPTNLANIETLDVRYAFAPLPISVNSNKTLNQNDNGKVLVCTSSPVLTINTGLPSGFAVSIKGDFTYDGTANVTDARTIGAADPWCSIINIGNNTYELIGGKI